MTSSVLVCVDTTTARSRGACCRMEDSNSSNTRSLPLSPICKSAAVKESDDVEVADEETDAFSKFVVSKHEAEDEDDEGRESGSSSTASELR